MLDVDVLNKEAMKVVDYIKPVLSVIDVAHNPEIVIEQMRQLMIKLNSPGKFSKPDLFGKNWHLPDGEDETSIANKLGSLQDIHAVALLYADRIQIPGRGGSHFLYVYPTVFLRALGDHGEMVVFEHNSKRKARTDSLQGTDTRDYLFNFGLPVSLSDWSPFHDRILDQRTGELARLNPLIYEKPTTKGDYVMPRKPTGLDEFKNLVKSKKGAVVKVGDQTRIYLL